MGQRRVNTSLSIQSNCFIQTLGPRVIEPDMHNQSTWHDVHQVRAVLFKTKMRALKTEQARDAFRLEHHEEMKIRATARGVTLPNELLAKGVGIQGSIPQGSGQGGPAGKAGTGNAGNAGGVGGGGGRK